MPTPVRISASEAFVETLAAHGVTEVFGIVGSAYMDAHDLFPLAGIRFISTAHEQNAAHMADGYARVTGRTGVCIAQNGPGVTNFVTAVAAAYWGHTPLVVITPEAASKTSGLGGFQETEQLPIFSKITKYQAHVNAPSRIAELTHRAFQLAQLERGPTQLNIPRDHFYGEFETVLPTPLPIRRGAGDLAALTRAAELLAAAKFPVIVAGAGVNAAGGRAELIALAEQLGAPVVNSYLHNDSFPDEHPLAAGPLGYQGSRAAMNLIHRADVVLALGTRLGPFGTLPQYGFDYWPRGAKVIQVDVDGRVLGLVKPVDVAVQGDARLAAAVLLEKLQATQGPRTADAGRIALVAAERRAWAAELAERAGQNEAERVDPRRALAALAAALPPDAIVSTDIGNVCSVANSYLAFAQPDSFLAAGPFGNCGYAYPTALGAKVGAPQRPVVAYVGDGAWGMSLAEVLTAVRENIAVVAVVFNNGQWGAEKRNQIDYFDSRFLGSELRNPDWAELARAMGADGVTVTREADIGPALRAALASGRPTVINLVLTQALAEPFRRDAFQPPRRLLEKYRAHSAKA
ncbi:sulfoacetaldehyde acetyltransferase [Rubrivivax gelatinosus]|uniref:sulfoacetaldehyde acetyltransferase n=1 Tax=Rubrivivax gelatinosus TaxID=28068 RepID=UPI0005C20F22|nr:sulfoacetaldehyde acetyltransferase [Rubrivivax gelatinosus]